MKELPEERKRKARERAARYRSENPERCRAAVIAWNEKNREYIKIRAKEYHRNNLEKRRLKNKEWREANKESLRRKALIWQSKNKHIIRHFSNIRIAKKHNRIHPDLDKSACVKLHAKCLEMEKNTGIRYDLDHIIPISYGGWHHQDNLQILPESVNASKRCNPIWEKDGFKSWRDVPRHLWPESLFRYYEALSTIQPCKIT